MLTTAHWPAIHKLIIMTYMFVGYSIYCNALKPNTEMFLNPNSL